MIYSLKFQILKYKLFYLKMDKIKINKNLKY